MRFVSERARIGDGKEMLVLVQIPEAIGTFYELYMKLQPRAIVEFANRYDGGAKSTIYLCVEIDDVEGDREAVLELLNTPKAGLFVNVHCRG
jgi:threonine dehydratase